MKKADYLKKAIQAGLANNLGWVFTAFCVTREDANAYQADPYPFRLLSTHGKYQCLMPDGKIEDIEGTSTKVPLFAFKDLVSVDSDWAANIKKPVECTIGNLIFNSVVILPSFGAKYPFTTGKITVKAHEAYIAPRLTDTPKPGAALDDNKLYVSEYKRFQDALVYMEQFAPITSWSTTKKVITKPDGIDKFRKELQAKYAGRLEDPKVFAEYEKELKDFDDAWLKDDPGYGTFLTGKVKDISRKKMFLAMGIPERLDLSEPIVPVLGTLEEGQPTDAKEYTAILNGARFGSFSRGAETVNGGVVSKSVIRVGSNYRVDMEDCGTIFGMKKRYYASNIDKLVGRTVVTLARGKRPDGSVMRTNVLIENKDQANNHLGQLMTIRSPAYCQAPGDRLCKVCAGTALSQFPDGIIIPLTELSQIILTQSLKAMHGKVLSTAEVDLESAIT